MKTPEQLAAEYIDSDYSTEELAAAIRARDAEVRRVVVDAVTVIIHEEFGLTEKAFAAVHRILTLANPAEPKRCRCQWEHGDRPCPVHPCDADGVCLCCGGDKANPPEPEGDDT